MRSEVQRKHPGGFELTEQELRRLYKTLGDHAARCSPALDVHRIETKFANLVVSSPASIDELFQLENHGPTAITRLRLTWTNEAGSALVFCEFVNVDADSEGSAYPISYEISGADRDWVFLANSDLEDRLKKIRIWNPNQVLMSRRGRLGFYYGILILASASMFLMVQQKAKQIDPAIAAKLDAIDEVETAWLGGAISDAEVQFELQRAAVASFDPFAVPLTQQLIAPLVPVLLPIVALVVFMAFSYLRPYQSFLWGERMDEVMKRRGIARFLLGGVVLAILLGVVANFATDFIKAL